MLEIKVGPPQIAIHHGHTVLVTEPDGQIQWPSDKGLYFRDTRLVSSWNLYANGEEWELLNSGALAYNTARIYLTNATIVTEDGEIPERTLSLVITRRVKGGLHEDFDITNYGRDKARFNLEIALRADFADIFEVKQGRIVRRGRITTVWDAQNERLVTTYRNRDFHRELMVEADRNGSRSVYANGRISFEVELPPRASWHTCLRYALVDGTGLFAAPQHCLSAETGAEAIPDRNEDDEWTQGVLAVETASPVFNGLYRQAVDDMAALRLRIEERGATRYIPAAGLPWFVALFGRDTLIAALQNTLVHPVFARGALEVLARWQATERDDYRDAEPGKILHELRLGELAHFKLIPHTPYYGTADATPLYVIVLHEAWRRTGDNELLTRHLAAAERCLEWIDRHGDRDGDGFQEFQTRSPAGYENQGWKDSGDSAVWPDGSPIKGPKALCELQGYVFDAWQRMAEIYDALGKTDQAETMRRKAREMFDRFNTAFWDEEACTYAYALDGQKQKVTTIVSNAGHLLWSGIVPPERAEKVVRRLMKPDMWSGWGIRTLSADHPSFNPYSYQNGSVWPHDNGIIALGLRRYGFAEEVGRLAHDVMRAASFFALNQLPELYAGIQRADSNFPVQYLGANVPQAWAAGSVFMLLEAILGIQPDAPRKRLIVDPMLPEWLHLVTLRNLRFGDEALDLRFERLAGETVFEVLKGDASRVVRRKDLAA